MHCHWTLNRIIANDTRKIHHKNPSIRISNEQLNCTENKLQRLFDRPKKKTKQNNTKEKKNSTEIPFEYVCQMEMWCLRQRIRNDVILEWILLHFDSPSATRNRFRANPLLFSPNCHKTDNNCAPNKFGLNESEEKSGEREREKAVWKMAQIQINLCFMILPIRLCCVPLDVLFKLIAFRLSCIFDSFDIIYESFEYHFG